ncbi:MAG: DUF4293 family protein [Muribaculaceae bacterium]
MVIQRWQTVLLALAVIVMAIFCSTPFATVSAAAEQVEGVYLKDAPVLMIVSILIGIVLFLSIFMYKDLKRQMTMTLVSMVLLVAAIVTGIFIVYYAMPDAHLVILGGVTLLVVTFILALGAYTMMNRDRKLLDSYNRLR